MSTRIPPNTLNPRPQRLPARPALGIPSPRVFSPVRALWLAAECIGLKALLIEAQTKITSLEESLRTAQAQQGRDAAKIADLIRRNRELTSALHRTACAG